MKDMVQIATRINNVNATINDWKNLYQVDLPYPALRANNCHLDVFACIEDSRNLQSVCPHGGQCVPQGTPILTRTSVLRSGTPMQLDEAFGEELFQIVQMISQLIDFDESKQALRLVIKPGVSSDLDELKHTYEGLGDFLVC